MEDPKQSIFPTHCARAVKAGVALFVLAHASPLLAQAWSPTGLPSTEYVRVASSSDGTTLLAGAWNGPMSVSTNSGSTWVALSPPLQPPPYGVLAWFGVACSADGSTLLGAAATGGLCVTTNLGQTWSVWVRSELFHAAASSADGGRLIAAADHSYASSSGIYLSSDHGVSWTEATLPGLLWFSAACSADGRTLAVGGPTVSVSIDSGETWHPPANLPQGNYSGLACSADGTRMIAGSFSSTNGPGGVFVSSDSGATWQGAGAGLPTGKYFDVASSADGKNLATALSGGAIYRSTDFGVSWTPMEAPLTNWYTIAGSADGNTLVAASMNGNSDYLGLVYTCHLTPAPELHLTCSEQTDTLSWTLPSRPFVLEQNSTALSSNWVEVTNSPILDYSNLHYQVTAPKSSGNKFYRLRGK